MNSIYIIYDTIKKNEFDIFVDLPTVTLYTRSQARKRPIYYKIINGYENPCR